jgi:hypothetical protein
MGNDWNIYVDSDALVHPEAIDFTELLPKDTVAHNGQDMANVRWTYDRFFRRDGRHIGSCNWLTFGSDWCVELWKPLDDLTLAEAVRMIRPTVNEAQTVVTADHLIDDFTLSRNIAKYGLKFTSVQKLLVDHGLEGAEFFWHVYTLPADEKVDAMKKVLKNWRL